MKKGCTALLLIFLAVSSGSLQGGDEGIFPFEYKKIELENGFKAYMIRAGAPGQIACVTFVRAGSRDEYEEGRSGYAHFFEHMMFRGTDRYPDYDAITGTMGALYNAFTSNDSTQYYLVTSSDNLEQALDLEADRFTNLWYTESEFRTEAGAILGEFSQGKSSPYFYLEEKAAETAFRRHTYGHLTIGYEEDVRRMPEGYAYSLDFYRRYYRPENCVLLLAGDFDFNRAETLIRRHYASWETGYRASKVLPEPAQTKPRRATVEFPGQTLPYLSVRYKGPRWDASDRITVATEVLGKAAFGENSDLYRKLVLQDGSAQSLNAGFELMRDPGLLSVTALVTDTDSIETVEKGIEDAIVKVRRDLIDPAEIERTKNALKYEFLMSLETALDVCFALRPFIVFTGGIEAVEEYFRTLSSVTPEDVKAAAGKYLADNGRTTVVLLPAGGGE